MKVALVCQSLLLSRALHLFLGEMVVSYKQCDIVISDQAIELEKPLFLIANHPEAHLSVPFSKSTLMLNLEKFFEYRQESKTSSNPLFALHDLEAQINALTEQFRQELIKTIHTIYGK